MRMPMLALLAAVLVLAPTLAQDEGGFETSGAADATVRLVNGARWGKGRVEVLHNGEWGAVCDEFWSDTVAEVVCTQLGLSGGRVSQQIGRCSDKIWMGSVQCSGSESRIEDCDHGVWGMHDCHHSDAIGAICDVGGIAETGASGETVRLVDGAYHGEGRVEVLHNGEWGTLCGHQWNEAKAEVVCRQLGLSGGEALTGYEYGGGSDKIWSDSFQCSGSESRIEDCSHDDWNMDDCVHPRDVWAVCGEGGIETTGASDATVRLTKGAYWGEGRVEVLHDGEWGAVCDEYWNATDAEVICRQLGLSGGQVLEEFGKGTVKIWIAGLECSGDESRIEDCSHGDWGMYDCSHFDVVGAKCGMRITTRPMVI